MKLTTEPAAWIEVIKLGILMGIAFGLQVTEVQWIAIVAFLGGVGVLIVRQATTSNQALDTAGIAKKDVTRAITNETVISGGTGTGPGK